MSDRFVMQGGGMQIAIHPAGSFIRIFDDELPAERAKKTLEGLDTRVGSLAEGFISRNACRGGELQPRARRRLR